MSSTDEDSDSGQQSSREIMIDATISSIYHNGLPGTTVTTVTDLAGLSRGMVRRVFDSKEALLAATMDSLRAEWTASGINPDTVDPLEEIEAAVRDMFSPAVFAPDKVAAWIALCADASNNEVLRQIRELAQAEWTTKLATSLQRLDLAQIDDVAAAIIAVADGLWLRHALEPGDMSRSRAENLAVLTLRAFVGESQQSTP